MGAKLSDWLAASKAADSAEDRVLRQALARLRAGRPPDGCPYEDLCRKGIVPSAYIGCSCWFFSHGGELADDGIHCGTPPMVNGVTDWNQRWPGDPGDEAWIESVIEGNRVDRSVALEVARVIGGHPGRLPETGRKG